MARRKKKKFRLRFFRIFLLIFLLCFAYFLYMQFVGDNIRNIYIHGTTRIADQEIIDIAGLSDYPSFSKTTSLSIKKKVSKLPLVKKVKVRKKVWLQLHIYVDEYKVLFRRKDNNKLVLDNGKEIDGSDIVDVPLLINFVPDTVFVDFVEDMNSIDDEILEKISEIKYSPNDFDSGRFELFMNDDNLVYISINNFDKLNKYPKMVSKLAGKRGILYLDSGNYFKSKK